MGCLVGCIALAMPRLALFLVFLFSDYLGRAYDTNLVPFLGFFFLPLTTLAYAFGINQNGSIEGLYVVVVLISLLVDLGLIGGASKRGFDS